METSVEKLTGFLGSGRPYSVPFDEVRSAQIAALNERLQERLGKNKLVSLRAKEADVTEIRDFDDVVPLLLPHTAYKSYPESFLIEQKWDRLTKWLGTVSNYQIENANLDGVADIDDWLERLERVGHYVNCSSGTTGKAAMLVASAADLQWTKRDFVGAYAWGSGIAPARDRRIMPMSPAAGVPRLRATSEAFAEAYSDPSVEHFTYPVPSITVGSITKMIALRRAMANGTARPDDIAEFEAVSAARQKAVDAAVGLCADALIAARKDKLIVSGMWANIYKVAEETRNRGYGAKDFNPENGIMVAGGLKGAKLPANYREYVYETFNIPLECNFQLYGMQELASVMPRCQKGGRYHIPPWIVCLPLNKDGDALLPMGGGEVEGRAAFFDLSLDGRWGGVISGDRIHVDFGPCECGAKSPSIRDSIARYTDLEGDDKISCAGTVDAYVRGLS
jgi:hypothetical protein